MTQPGLGADHSAQLTDRPVADVEDPAVEGGGPAGDDGDVPAELRVKVGAAGREVREGPAVQHQSVHAVNSSLLFPLGS